MKLQNLEIMYLLNKYAGSCDYRKDVENMLEHGSGSELIEAILEIIMLAEQPENFKTLYPESEVL